MAQEGPKQDKRPFLARKANKASAVGARSWPAERALPSSVSNRCIQHENPILERGSAVLLLLLLLRHAQATPPGF